MAYEWIAPAITGAVGLVSSWYANKAAKKRARDERRFIEAANARQEEFARRSYEEQNQRDIDFWKMQNAYNDPAAQMQRMQSAGLNPNLVYGSGTSNLAGPIATHSAPQPQLQKTAPFETDETFAKGIGSSIFEVLNVATALANISRTEADTKRVMAQTAGQEFENKIKGDSSYIAGILRRVQLDNTSLHESNKGKAYENMNTEALQGFSAHGDTLTTVLYDDLSPNLKLAGSKAEINRTIELAKNAALTGKTIEFENIIKGFEARLAEQGIFRGDDGWSRLFNYLLNNVFENNLSGTAGGAVSSAIKLLQPLLNKKSKK